jgi:segregation and condensation protein B
MNLEGGEPVSPDESSHVSTGSEPEPDRVREAPEVTSARLRSAVASILLVSADPVPAAKLREVILGEEPELDEGQVDLVLEGLGTDDEADTDLSRGFWVQRVGNSFQLRTTAANRGYVRRFLAAKPERLSKPAMETLAVVAYRQPVSKPEIEDIRGVDAGGVLKSLLERDLIRVVGKREELGRPLTYGTTREFLSVFGLPSIADLPTLQEFHELDEAHQAEVDSLVVSGLAELCEEAGRIGAEDGSDLLSELDEAVLKADRLRAALGGGASEDADSDLPGLVPPGASAPMPGYEVPGLSAP